MKKIILLTLTILLIVAPMASAYNTPVYIEPDEMTWEEVLPEYYKWLESEYGTSPTVQQQATLDHFVQWLTGDDE